MAAYKQPNNIVLWNAFRGLTLRPSTLPWGLIRIGINVVFFLMMHVLFKCYLWEFFADGEICNQLSAIQE